MEESRRDIVLFLGAGFSLEAGLPIMASFGKASRLELRNQASWAKSKECGEMFSKAGNIFEQFMDYCSSAKQYISIDINNMEDVFCIAEAIQESDLKEIKLNSNPIKIYELLSYIKLWLWKNYQRCPIVAPPQNDATPYNSLIHLLTTNDLINRLRVLTTNYDIIFEYAAWSNGVNCSYANFKYESIDVPFAHENIDASNYKEKYISTVVSDSSPIICKLHGSINYFTSNGEFLINEGLVPANSLVGKSYVKTKRPAILPVDALVEMKKKLPELMPAIVPPTYAKFTGSVWLKNIWNEAYKAIASAKHIIFIGYSMPSSDGFMRALFQSALATRGKEPLKVTVVDPKAHDAYELYRNYKKLFAPLGDNLKMIPKGFSEAIESDLTDIIGKL